MNNNNINLKIGDQGTLVAQLQQMLAELGYRVPEESSVFDSTTQRALKAFQNDFRFKVTGTVDIRMWQALEKHTGRSRRDAVENVIEIPLGRLTEQPEAMLVDAPATEVLTVPVEMPKEMRTEQPEMVLVDTPPAEMRTQQPETETVLMDTPPMEMRTQQPETVLMDTPPMEMRTQQPEVVLVDTPPAEMRTQQPETVLMDTPPMEMRTQRTETVLMDTPPMEMRTQRTEVVLVDTPPAEMRTERPVGEFLEEAAETPMRIQSEAQVQVTVEKVAEATARPEPEPQLLPIVINTNPAEEMPEDIPIIPALVDKRHVAVPLAQSKTMRVHTMPFSDEYSDDSQVQILTAPVDRTPAQWPVSRKKCTHQKNEDNVPACPMQQAPVQPITPDEAEDDIPVIEAPAGRVSASRRRTVQPSKSPKKYISTDETTSGRPTLRQGATGVHVMELQNALNRLGFLGSMADGYFGTFTTNAVRAFQGSCGCESHGIVDSVTWAAVIKAITQLDGNVAKELLREGDTGPMVVELQLRLKKLGYYDGGVDGIFGAKTTAALREFQKPHNLRVDGIAGPESWDALDRAFQGAPAPAAKSVHATLREGDRGEDVVLLQEILRKLDFNPGPPDGVFGYGTATALKEFQTSLGLVSDGVAGPITWAMLDKAASGDGLVLREQ